MRNNEESKIVKKDHLPVLNRAIEIVRISIRLFVIACHPVESEIKLRHRMLYNCILKRNVLHYFIMQYK